MAKAFSIPYPIIKDEDVWLEFAFGYIAMAAQIGNAAYLVFLFTVRLPFVRLGVWFVVWFSACTYIYCLAGLFYRSSFGNMALLLTCYLLNRFLNALLSAGEKLRGRITAGKK